MTETEIQKLFAYQYGLLNNNLVLPNITMKGSEGGNYEADLIYILIPEGRCAKSAQGRTVSSMTNLDKIRTMPPEELGTFLSNLVAIEDCFECPIRDVCNERMVNPNNEAFHTCELSFYHWLQREYKPGYFENQ